jgi:dCTP deaminase
MILSGEEIRRRMGQDIVIEPFEPANLNPNSYNLTLCEELLVYEEIVLDMKKPNRTERIIIPPEGLILTPNQLYLGRTYWTLEMFAVQPVKIYPGVPICQIFYHQIVGDIVEYKSDKYQHNRDIQPSLLYKELSPDSERERQMKLFAEGVR